MATDEELLAAWRGGDRRAGNDLYLRHYQTVRRFFVNKVDSDLEDLIQKTFEICVRNRDRIENSANFLAYLRGIARKLLFRHWEAAAKRDRLDDIDDLSLADLGAGMSSIVARAQADKRAFDALRRIRLADQELLEFYYLDEKTGTQLAELYGVPENTLRSRLRRAREAWQAEYNKLERTAGVRMTPAEEFERHTNVLQFPPNPEPEPVGC